MSTKQERKAERMEAEKRLEQQRAIELPRHPHDGRWGYWGAGELRIQLIHRPAFGTGVCYEIRGDLGNLRLFRSRFNRRDEDLVVGHERVDAKPSLLYRVMQQFEEINIPLRMPRIDYGVLDGERFEFATFAGIVIMARFVWRISNAAPGWERLIELTETHIKDFDARGILEDDGSG